MKKLCSLALTLCMILSLISAVSFTSAAEFTSAPIDATATTAIVDGVEYKVLRTAADFLAIEDQTGNFIFANDINLDTTKEGDNAHFLDGFNGILNGNGYALYGYGINKSNNGGLFDLTTKTFHMTFLNLSFGKADAPIAMLSNGNGSCGAVVGKLNTPCNITFKNCHAYVNFTGAAHALKGAFIGAVQGGTVTHNIVFEDCSSNGKIIGKNKNGGFIGSLVQTISSVSFLNCVNNTRLDCVTQGIGGFIGDVADKANYTPSVSFENCVNNGAISATDNGVGGLIGYIRYNANVRIKNCENNGTLTVTDPAAGFTGFWIGNPVGDGGVANITVFLNEGAGLIGAEFGNSAKQTAENTVITIVSFAEKPIGTAAELAAINASGTYTVTAPITIDNALTLDVTGKEITLKLGGQTVTGSIMVVGDGVFALEGEGSLTAADATQPALMVSGTANVSVKKATVGGIAILNANAEITESTVNGSIGLGGAAKLALNATVNAGAEPVIYLASKAEAEVDNTVEVTVSGGSYTTTGATAVVWSEAGAKLTVNAGAFTATESAISVSAGTVKIGGGKLTAKNALELAASELAIDVQITGGSFEGTEAAVAVNNLKDTCIGLIKGGSFKGALKAVDGSKASLLASAGSFDAEPDAKFLQQYYVAAKNAETGLYEVILHTCDYEGVEYEYMNSGSHSKSCKICGEKVTEAHAWSEYKDNGDGTHSKFCEGCQSKSNPQEHVIKTVDNKDGTHKNTCSGCDLNESVAHVYENGACKECKAKESSATSASGGEEKGGCGSAVSALGLVMVLALAAPMLKKGKND